jgi:Fic family protein
MADISLRQADRLYQGFPDFADWPSPGEGDLRLWDRFASRLEEIRSKATPEALRKAVDVAVRAAAIDTGAIEGLYSVDRGFTMTVATQALAWEHAIQEKGEDVRDLFEAQLQAYELVIDAVTGHHPISEAWIRALHETLCGPQGKYRVLTDQGWQEHDLEKGAYKTQPNHVRLADASIHPYAPVDRVGPEMHRLLEQIRTPAFESAHSIAQASYIHYGFVVIHPFADGNGRVARALASVFFYRALSIPFLVFANQRTAYFDVLHRTDLGAAGPLLAFFRDRGIDTVQLVVDQLLTATTTDPEETLSKIKATSTIDDTALRLLASIGEEFRRQAKQPSMSELSDRLRLVVTEGFDLEPTPAGYRRVPGLARTIDLLLSGKTHTMVRHEVRTLIAGSESNPFTFLVEATKSADTLEVRFEDAHPGISDALRLRLSHWVQRQLTRMLEEWTRNNWR